MTLLKYQPHARIEDLAIGECTLHRASGASGARWWQLWFHVLRDSDGQPAMFCVPVSPRGSFADNGPGGRTWGLTCPQASAEASPPGTHDWVISPSIDVKDNQDAVAGHEADPRPSLWHQTPEIVDVPDSEPWARGEVP